MKILSVCSNYRVFGAETIMLRLLDGLKRKGHEQCAVTSIWTDGDFSRRLSSIGIPEEQLGLGAITLLITPRTLWWMANTFSRLPVAWFRWSRRLQHFRPDLLVFTSSRQCLYFYPWLGRQPSILIEFTNIEPSAANRRLYHLLSRKLACFVAVSDFMRVHLQRVGASANKISVIKSGAFFERQRSEIEGGIRTIKEGDRKGPRIGIVGQVAACKGHDCLVEAVRLLAIRGFKLQIQVFGNGDSDYTERLKRRVAETGLTSVWNWMGYECDKSKIFSSMDICVVPSCFGDPFPTVAMEAGAHGIPVVASRIGGLPEIVIDGLSGWLCDANNPVQFADRIEELIRQPERARQMGASGRELVFTHFTVEKMVMEFEALFGEHLRKQHAHA